MFDDDISNLFASYQTLVSEKGPMRAIDAAQTLGVTEAELVEAKMYTGAVVRLRRSDESGFASLLEGMVGLGEVMCLTRNAHVVHERYGEFDNVNIGKVMGMVLNKTIDLRVFMNRWAYGFIIEEELSSGLRVSLQFFDKSGTAVHKIYPTDATDRAAFDALVEQSMDDAPTRLVIEPIGLEPKDRPDHAVDVPALRADWEAMTNTHQFFGLLKKHNVGRQQSLRLIGKDFAYQLPKEAVTKLLERAVETSVPIMVFVNSYGCIQIHTGTIQNVKAMGPWINVLDEKFHMHLRQDHVENVWVVKKPTVDGFVTSCEVFNADGQHFCMFFGERHEGSKELPEWRELLSGLSDIECAT